MKCPLQSAVLPVLYHAWVPGTVGSRGGIHEGQTRKLSSCCVGAVENGCLEKCVSERTKIRATCSCFTT